MICRSFRTVVYPRDFCSESAAYTSRTVEGPRAHNTRRISSSEAVGFWGVSWLMGRGYYEDLRIVNENLRTSFRPLPGPLGGNFADDFLWHFGLEQAQEREAVGARLGVFRPHPRE